MSKTAALCRLGAIAIACGCVSLGAASPAAAQVNPAQVLQIKPKSDDVVITTPEPAEVAKCSLEVIKTPGGGSGYLLSDATKRPLRKFIDSDGDGRVDTWSFFKDGAEVYRESIAGKGYAFRWLGAGGMKWGVGSVGADQKARVEQWRMISAEETAQEAFTALQTGDFERLKTLFITTQEMQSLGLPAAETQRLAALQAGAAAKFQKVRGKVPSLPQAKFSRLESAHPGAYPADVTGGTQDVIKANGLILFENPTAEKKHDWIQSGDLIQVGNAWRLTDVPNNEDTGPVVGGTDPALAKLLTELAEIDGQAPAARSPELGAWTMKRIAKIREIAEKAPAAERENWYKQIFDNLAGAVVGGDGASAEILAKYKDQFEKAMPGSSLAAYGAYRHLWSTAQVEMVSAAPAQLPKIQEKYHESLEKFIETYPKAEDGADAMIQLATGSEFSGKEDVAKKWYAQIASNFPTSMNAAKARGAIKRIDSIGKAFELNGPTIDGGTYQLKPGKATVVYYWASYSSQATGDFANLRKLRMTHPDLEIVTVNLDDKAADAQAFLKTVPGTMPTLHQPSVNGGMDSELARQYGIFGLPHLFLIDRDGKVVNNKAQVNMLDDEIGRLTKK